MKKLFAAFAVLLLGAGPSFAQKTGAQINTEITSTFIDNTVGAITPLGLRTVTADIVNSIMPTAPVTSGNLACFSGTTGLLRDCASSPTPNAITALTGDLTAAGPGSVAATLATVNSNVGSFGDATTSATVTVNAKGLVTAASSQTLTPAVGSITGLGTGVATGLGGNATGSGGPVLTTSPTLVTPNVGVATATSINKVAVTAPASSATLTIADGTTLTETSSTSVGRGQYLGEASTGSATAGNIGETISQNILVASGVGLTNNTAANVATITLTAGDWDIAAQICFNGGATTVTSALRGSVSTTTATENTVSPNFAAVGYPASSAIFSTTDTCLAIAPDRRSLSGSQQYWLVAFSNFATSTLKAYGQIRARRVR